ncbi:MAG: hypothetical protein ACRER2_18245 [Methylococcales bacterium]
MNLKPIIDQLIKTPLLTSLFVVDFVILTFYKPWAFFSLVLLGGLVALSMYFGQKLKLYSIDQSS